ncbi:RNA helicase, partial [Cichlidogyrus casuarinus]
MGGGFVEETTWNEKNKVSFSMEKKFNLDRSPHEAGHENPFLSSQASINLLGQPSRNSEFAYPLNERFSEIEQLDPRLLESLGKMGLDRMSHIQKHATGILMQDETNDQLEVTGKYDMMAAAQTGSGKTLAFLLPIANRLLNNYPASSMQALVSYIRRSVKAFESLESIAGAKEKGPKKQYPLALVLAPTRELVQQINNELMRLTVYSMLRSVAVFGGEKPSWQMQQLSRGAHMLVATPGRLLDFLEQDLISLRFCRNLVLDEADQMLEFGFEPQLKKIFEPRLYHLPSSEDGRQTSLFSATFPTKVALLARHLLRGDRCVSLSIAYHNPDGSKPNSMVLVPEWGANPNRNQDESETLLARIPAEIQQHIKLLPQEARNQYKISAKWLDILCETISEVKETATEEPCRILVFCNRKKEADIIDTQLYQRRYSSRSIHGDRSQQQRDQALREFKNGHVEVLVATSVAARGLDIPNVTAVINIGCPNNLDDYVHRIGRTGRLGKKGQAVTILDLTNDIPASVKGVCDFVKAKNPDAEIDREIIDFARSRSSSANEYGRNWRNQKERFSRD